jgi:serine/threonine protein kinase
MLQEQHIGPYKLKEKIGRGGMAEIFRAEKQLANGKLQSVAIKRLFPSFSADREFVGMFVNEARIASSMDHENVIRTYDLINIGSYYYIIMEYLPGLDLEEIIGQAMPGKMVVSLPEMAYVAHEIALGLNYAHAGGGDSKSGPVVHRDITPGNILISNDGQVKITDFGIARAEQYVGFTKPGILKGKYEYMSPEYVKGLDFDGRADLFSLGVVMYEMAVGTNPFVGMNPKEIWNRIVKEEPTPPGRIVPGITKEFDAVVTKALSKNPDDRYRNGEEFAKALAPMFSKEGRKVVAGKVASRVEALTKQTSQPKTTHYDIEEFLPADDGDGSHTQQIHLDELLDLVPPGEAPNPCSDNDTTDVSTAPRMRAIERPKAKEKEDRVSKKWLIISASMFFALLIALICFWPKDRGYLTVISDMRAEVFISGQSIGFTPIKKHSLATGVYEIEVRRLGREQVANFQVTIEKDNVYTKKVKWQSRKRKYKKRPRKKVSRVTRKKSSKKADKKKSKSTRKYRKKKRR